MHHSISLSCRLWGQPHHAHWHVHISQLPDALLPQLWMLLVVESQPRQPIWTGIWRLSLGASSQLHFRLSGCMYQASVEPLPSQPTCKNILIFTFEIQVKETFKQSIHKKKFKQNKKLKENLMKTTAF